MIQKRVNQSKLLFINFPRGADLLFQEKYSNFIRISYKFHKNFIKILKNFTKKDINSHSIYAKHIFQTVK